MDVRKLEAELKAAKTLERKLDLLDEIATYYYEKDNYQKALKYYEKGEALAPEGNLRAYYMGQKGICYYLQHQDQGARQALLAAKEMFQLDKSDFMPEMYGLVQFFLGSLHEYSGENPDSLEARLEALKYLDQLHREAQWMLLSGISRNYEERGDNRKAIDYSTRAISLIANDDPEIAYIYESLGINHYELGEYEEAEEYLSRVLQVAPEFERKDDIYFNIGLCYQRLLDFRLALDSYLKILQLKELSSKDESLCWLYIEIARCYYQLKEYKKSLQFVRKGLKEPVEEKEELADVRGYLTNNLYALGRFQEAAREGEKTLKISQKFPHMEIMLSNLALSYYKLNQKDKFKFYRDWCNRAFPDFGWTKQLNKLKA